MVKIRKSQFSVQSRFQLGSARLETLWSREKPEPKTVVWPVVTPGLTLLLALETSKRTSSHMVAKVKKKVADKHRKDKKNAKKDITWKSSQLAQGIG